jgi:hydrogenase/urease accessory protein HupE
MPCLKLVPRDSLGVVLKIVALTSWAAVAGLVSLARAHDPGISTAEGVLRAGRLELIAGFSPVDAEELLPASVPRTGKWTQVEFDAAREHLMVVAAGLWEVQAADRAIPLCEARVELLPGDNVSFQLVFAPLVAGKSIRLRALRIPDLPGNHRQFVIIADENGMVLAKKLLSARDSAIEVGLDAAGGAQPAESSPGATAPSTPMESHPLLGFVRLGVEHIWTGYDHLLFLFALLLVCRSFRSMVGIVTCFTLAHSLTLALATFNLVHLPSRFVEGAIAASIFFVGAENLFRQGAEPRGRWAVTFGFGLIHGFGFASVLRDLGLGADRSVIGPLFSFNVGVELGQIAVAAIVLPVIWRLRQMKRFVDRGVPALSIAVAAAGLFWLLQRTVFA